MYTYCIQTAQNTHTYCEQTGCARAKRTRNDEQDRDAKSHTSALIESWQISSKEKEKNRPAYTKTRGRRYLCMNWIGHKCVWAYFCQIFLVCSCYYKHTAAILEHSTAERKFTICASIADPFACLLTPFLKTIWWKMLPQCVALLAV